MKKQTFVLHELREDVQPEGKTSVTIEQANKFDFCIRPHGYGDKTSADGHGYPVIMEYYNGKLRLLVWADINKEDPTHVIDLEGARESNREQSPDE